MLDPKVATSFFHASGAMHYWAFSEFMNMTKASVDFVGAGVENTWNKNEDKWRQQGEIAGEIVGAGAMFGVQAQMLINDQKVYGRWFDGKPIDKAGAIEAKAYKGMLYQEMAEGEGYIASKISGRNLISSTEMVKDAALLERLGAKGSKDVVGGIIRTTNQGSKFIKNHGFIGGIAPFAIAFGVGMAAKATLGFVGGLLDEDHNADMATRRVKYDNRFFQTQYDTQSNYGQLGMAMNNYQSRMQSTSRVYHAR